MSASCSSSSSSTTKGSSSSNVFSSLFASSTISGSQTGFADLFQAIPRPGYTPDVPPSSSSESIALCLSVNQGFGKAGLERRQYPPGPQPALSATALLQKAAQMGPASSNASLLRGLGIVSSSSPNATEIETDSGLGLGLSCDGGSGLKELMLGTPSVFGPKHTTLDLLGLGMAVSGGSTGGLSALMAAPPFDGDEMRRAS